MRNVFCVLAFAACALWAADKPDLTGTWQVDASHAGKLKISSIQIHQTGDNVEIAEASGPDAKAKTVHLTCALGGQQCESKEAGEEVSFWYNGAALVMMEMRHGKDVVIKTRLEPADDGKTLKMQVTHISPSGKDEEYTLTRAKS